MLNEKLKNLFNPFLEAFGVPEANSIVHSSF